LAHRHHVLRHDVELRAIVAPRGAARGRGPARRARAARRLSGVGSAELSGGGGHVSPLSVTLDRTPARVAALVSRVALGALFVYTAYGKIVDPPEFAVSIVHYHLVPDVIATTMAAALPFVELVVGLALLTGVHARGAAIVAGAMLVVFAVA